MICHFCCYIQTYPDSHSTPKAWADFARASFHVEEGALTKTPFFGGPAKCLSTGLGPRTTYPTHQHHTSLLVDVLYIQLTVL